MQDARSARTAAPRSVAPSSASEFAYAISASTFALVLSSSTGLNQCASTLKNSTLNFFSESRLLSSTARITDRTR